MRKIIVSFLLIFAMILPSCVRRTIIPDEELALIFRDAFLANAYVLDMNVKFDTLQVYQPIFDRYGYSVEDVSYTIGSFSKRKSARLGDVVEQAIELLEQGEEVYKYETMILDTIEAKASRAAKRQFFYKDRVNYYSQRDTTDLLIELEDLQPGDYRISFEYYVDSLDTNRSSYRSMSWVVKPGTDLKRGLTTSHLRKRDSTDLVRTLSLDTLTSKVVVVLAESFEKKRDRHVTFWDIKVDYTPPVEVAVEEYFKDKLNVRIFSDDLLGIQQKDSLELSPL